MEPKDKAILGAVISFFLPGLGLLLTENYDRFKAILMFIGLLIADMILFFVGTIGLLCVVGLFLYFVPLLIHIGAAVYTYDMFMKEQKGKPIYFK
ncbi:hypothetical protein JXB01_00075 [Candidatus Micrarchaeota archaeon]|nr:hypothetical protein [Candidatus Micrarchaeota archaeon]